MLYHDPFQPKPSIGFCIVWASLELGSVALFTTAVLLVAALMQGGQ